MSESESLSSRAAELFGEFLQACDQGAPADFDALCAAHPDLAPMLRAMHGCRAELQPEQPDQVDPVTWNGMLERLATHSPAVSRYEVKRSIDEGGMGQILEVWDHDLRRRLAMKVIRGETLGGDQASARRERVLGRFLEEAQISAQLDHPGIVPVHELGLRSDGLPFFTMKLVRGQDLRAVFRSVQDGADGWTRTRALGVLLRVCEAIAFAHSRGVIHRDLKPANVMVGRFGETYVMDWGLARVVGKDGKRRPEPGPDASEARSASIVRTDRRILGDERPDSPVFTADGDVLGTPPYMPPEQALGDLGRIDPRADCYAIGAMLYELLTGQMPYVPRGASLKAKDVHRQVLAGPPAAVHELVKDVPAELTAICDKAMARAVEQRYQTALELAEDLRAYLENRVVRAHRTGPWIEFRKWMQRNRGVAAALGALVVLAIGASLAIALVESARSAQAQLTADLQQAGELVAAFDRFGPVHPDGIGERVRWLARAQALVATRAQRERELARLRAGIAPRSDGAAEAEAIWQPAWPEYARTRDLLAGLRDTRATRQAVIDDAEATAQARDEARLKAIRIDKELAWLPARVEHLRKDAIEPMRYRLPDENAQREHDRVATLVHHLGKLTESKGLIEAVRAEIEQARELRARTLDRQAEPWQDAIASIADPTQCPLYGGLTIVPQIGLVPLGRDPDSGLWEFWHVLSGERPQRDANGRLRVEDDSGIVLVLVPGGTFWMGAQKRESATPNYDAAAAANEQSPREVDLAPYFLAKYEVTQGQWQRATGTNPSEYAAGTDWGGVGTVPRTHPVERVDWYSAARALRRWSLDLPTEAQFERALRAGSTTPYWIGADAAGLTGFVNGHGSSDGFLTHAPVDALAPNPFGFFHLAGNVAEWCRDWYADTLDEATVTPESGELLGALYRSKTYRGGNWKSGNREFFRSARRLYRAPDERNADCGVRAARALDR
jgi:formylglycine-generating enzyme required for sulfatase activity/serine/threonine protein kinase